MSETTTVRMSNRRVITRITFVALFSALIAGGTFIAIPLPFSPVPIVLQNLFIVLAGLVLGPALGAAAAGLYLLAGALGLPVFAGAVGGAAHFLGPTGGFLAGYFFSALAAGLAAGRPKAGKTAPLFRLILASACGFLVVYVPGLAWLYRLMGNWAAVFAAGFFPFLIGDALKAVSAVAVASRLRRAAADKLAD
ncbi:MAG: biotin transporter BioY [Treponema sp.]|nr:biotin transporter BioY [Treponema sp.]